MPWNHDYTKYTAHPDPGRPQPAAMDDPAAQARYQEAVIARDRWFRRFIVEAAEVPRYCPRKGCGRSRSCVSPDVECYKVALPVLRKAFFPRLRAARDKLRQSRQDAARRGASGPSPGRA